MRKPPTPLSLSTTPARIGPLAALTLIELALKQQIRLTDDDLYELEHVVIDVLTQLHDELLALEPMGNEP